MVTRQNESIRVMENVDPKYNYVFIRLHRIKIKLHRWILRQGYWILSQNVQKNDIRVLEKVDPHLQRQVKVTSKGCSKNL